LILTADYFISPQEEDDDDENEYYNFLPPGNLLTFFTYILTYFFSSLNLTLFGLLDFYGVEIELS